MLIETTKQNAKLCFIRSLILLTICVPLTLGAILKFIYAHPESENLFLKSILSALKDVVVKIYQNFQTIELLWPVFPQPNSEQLFTTGNLMALIAFTGFAWGIASFHSGAKAMNDLARAKRNARRKNLEREYWDNQGS